MLETSLQWQKGPVSTLAQCSLPHCQFRSGLSTLSDTVAVAKPWCTILANSLEKISCLSYEQSKLVETLACPLIPRCFAAFNNPCYLLTDSCSPLVISTQSTSTPDFLKFPSHLFLELQKDTIHPRLSFIELGRVLILSNFKLHKLLIWSWAERLSSKKLNPRS